MTDPITERIRRLHSDIPQDGLFEAPEAAPSEEPQHKVAKPKIVMRVECPMCRKESVGVIRVLDDRLRARFIITAHDRVTRGGHRFPCAGTGTDVMGTEP